MLPSRVHLHRRLAADRRTIDSRAVLNPSRVGIYNTSRARNRASSFSPLSDEGATYLREFGCHARPKRRDLCTDRYILTRRRRRWRRRSERKEADRNIVSGTENIRDFSLWNLIHNGLSFPCTLMIDEPLFTRSD